MKLALIFFIIIAVSYWRFNPWVQNVFFMDDSHTLFSFYNKKYFSTLYQSLFEQNYYKYRPVSGVVFYFLILSFGKTHGLYFAFNLVMHAINGVLFFILSSRLSKDKFIVPFALTMAFVLSRLALFQVTQIVGVVESVSLTFFLIMLYAVLRSQENPSQKMWHRIALLAVTLTIYAHERYVVVLPWLAFILFNLPSSKDITLKYRSLLVSFCAIIFISNVLFKVLFLHIPFFMGTGGQAISLDFPMIITHIYEALFSIFSFNNGPEYLVGSAISITQSSKYEDYLAFLMAVAFTFSSVYICIRSISTSRNLLKSDLKFLFQITLLIGLILIPPILTIRVEGRWEYVPSALILLTLAWSYGLPKTISSKGIGGLCVVASICLISVDSMVINKSFNSIYMISASKLAKAFKVDVLDSLNYQKPNDVLLLLDQGSCQLLVNYKIFELYGNSRQSMYCAETKNQLIQLQNDHVNGVVFEYKDNRFIQIPVFKN